MRRKFAISVLLITLILTLTSFSFSSSSNVAKLTFNPIPLTLTSGGSFTINLTLLDVTNLNCWQTTIKFDGKILNCINVSLPQDNIFSGHSTIFPTPKIDNNIGQVSIFCALDEAIGVNGSGTLCTVQFKALKEGVSTIKYINVGKMWIDGTYLQDPNGQTIPFETTIDVIQITGQGFIENTFTITYGSETLQVKTLSNSTITNLTYNQTLKAITYDATGPDNTKGACIITIPQKIMNTTLIALSDNTPLKTFITELNTLPENGTHNFLYYSYTHTTHKIKIYQTIAGDITGDKKVDIKDVAIASRSFGTTPESPNYRQTADINDDGKVDIKDVSYISKNFGKYIQQ
jgi:hypothetical protein